MMRAHAGQLSAFARGRPQCSMSVVFESFLEWGGETCRFHMHSSSEVVSTVSPGLCFIVSTLLFSCDRMKKTCKALLNHKFFDVKKERHHQAQSIFLAESFLLVEASSSHVSVFEVCDICRSSELLSQLLSSGVHVVEESREFSLPFIRSE
jgi:hypothetical protein